MSDNIQPDTKEKDVHAPSSESAKIAAAGWRQVRESRGISIDEVSASTHIPVRKLEAIENGEFSELGTQTFAAGYLRSYAKIIGENPDDCIAVYYQSIGFSPGESASQPSRVDAPMLLSASPKKKFPILPISVGVIVVWIAVMLLSSDDEDSPERNAVKDSDAQSMRLEPTPTKMEDMVTTATPMPLRAAVSSRGGNVNALPTENSVATSIQDRQTSEQELSTEAELTASSQISTRASTPNPENHSTSAQLNPMSEPAEGDDILVFSFSGECWLEVQDGEGKVLIAQLKRKGDNLRLFGQGPFQVMMGNAQVVTLTINGVAVSTQPVSGKKTRRMTVVSPE